MLTYIIHIKNQYNFYLYIYNTNLKIIMIFMLNCTLSVIYFDAYFDTTDRRDSCISQLFYDY